MSADEHLSPQQFMYHVTGAKNRENIQKRGLRPGSAMTGKSVWGWTVDPSDIIKERSGIGMDERHQDIWKADVTGLPSTHGSDRRVDTFREWRPEDPVVAVRKRVPPERLTLHRESDFPL